MLSLGSDGIPIEIADDEEEIPWDRINKSGAIASDVGAASIAYVTTYVADAIASISSFPDLFSHERFY